MPLATPATSRYWTSAWTLRCGLNISVKRSRRGSGTLTVARLGSSVADEKPPVGASDRVSALNTVVLPDDGRPRITSFVVTTRTFRGNSGARHHAGRPIIGQTGRNRLITARYGADTTAGHRNQIAGCDVEQVVLGSCSAVNRVLLEHGTVDDDRCILCADSDRGDAARRVASHIEHELGIGELQRGDADRRRQPLSIDP